MEKITTKLISSVLALSMFLSLVPVIVSADEELGAEVNGTAVTSLAQLKEKMTDGATVKLTSDWNMYNWILNIPANTSITLDLNGHVMDRRRTNDDKTQRNGEVIYCSKKSTLTITDSDPSAVHNGSVINDVWMYNSGNAEPIRGGIITGGSSSNGGGAIHIKDGAKVIMYAGTIAGNMSSNNGGGVQINGDNNSKFIMNGGAFMYNKAAKSYGGALSIENGRAEITNGEFIANKATGSYYGGAIYLDNKIENVLKIYGSGDGKQDEQDLYSVVFRDNSANYGGAVYIANGSNVPISGAYFKNNKANSGGGAIYFNSSKNSVSKCYFTDNKTDKDGGGVFANKANILVSHSTFTKNYAAVNGGAIDFNGKSPSLSNSVITNNSAGSGKGGGVYVSDGHSSAYQFNLSGKVIIKDNTAGEKTGNLYMEGKNKLVVGDLDSETKIGVSAANGAAGYNGIINPITAKPSKARAEYFTSDDTGYSVKRQDDPTKINYRHFYFDSGENKLPDAASVMPGEKEDAGTYTVAGITYNKQKGYYRYLSIGSPEQDMTNAYYYSDGLFADEPNIYNPHLASMGMNLAMSAFGAHLGETDDYSNKFNHVTQLLSDIGCKQEDIYVNDYYMVKPKRHSIGVCIANKKLQSTEGDTGYYLIPIAVRGSFYESEWAGNVTLDTGSGEALGFKLASEQIIKEVENYISARQELKRAADEGKLKFWVSGYSRAGGTSNLVSKKLTDIYCYNDHADNPNRVYGYTFATVAAGTDATGDFVSGGKNHETYTNIHNIINKSDLVPNVAPALMSFKHYGVDHYVPGSAAGNVQEGTNKNAIIHFDNDAYPVSYDKNSSYLLQRTKMVKQLYAMNPNLQFDDYFHVATMNYIASALNIKEMNAEVKDDVRLQKDWIVDFMSNLLNNSMTSAGAGHLLQTGEGSKDNYRDMYNSISGLLRADSKLSTSVSFQEAVATIFLLLHSGNTEQVEAIGKMTNGLMDRVPKYALWKEVLGNVYSIKQERYDYWINYFWNLLVEEPSAEDKAKGYDYLKPYLIKKNEAGETDTTLYDNLKAAWPTIMAVALDFMNDDYKGNDNNDIGTLIYNINSIGQGHWPEVNLAWIRSYDDWYDNETGWYAMSVDAAEPSRPEAAIGEKKLSSDAVNTSRGNTTITLSGKTRVLDTELSGGEAIYYSVKSEIDGKLTESGKQLYRGAINLSAPDKGTNKYTITAYTMAFDQKSESVEYNINVEPDKYELTITDAAGNTKSDMYASGDVVAVQANTPNDKVFSEWESNVDIAGFDTTKEAGSFKMPSADVSVTAKTVDKISNITVSVAYPKQGEQLPETAEVKFYRSAQEIKSTNSSLSWYAHMNNKDIAISGNLIYDDELTGKFIIEEDAANKIIFDNNVSITLGSKGKTIEDGVKITKTEPGVYMVEISVIPDAPDVVRVVAPDDIKVAAATTWEELSAVLPKTISVETTIGYVDVPVTWNGDDYENTAGEKTISGTADYKSAGLTAPSDSVPTIKVIVIDGANIVKAPKAKISTADAEHDGNNYYIEGNTLTVQLTSDTEGAKIYYKINGEDTEKEYTAPIELTASAGESKKYTITAYAAHDGMEKSAAATFVYTVTALSKHTVTIHCADKTHITDLNTDEIYTVYGDSASIIAPGGDKIKGMSFDGWSSADVPISDSSKGNNQITIDLTSKNNVTVNANYVPVADRILLDIKEPSGGEEIQNTVAGAKITVADKTYDTDKTMFHVKWSDTGKADYNTQYHAVITAKENAGIIYSENVIVMVNGEERDAILNRADNEIYYIATTPKAKLLSVGTVSNIIAGSGASKASIVSRLPKTVSVTTEDNSYTYLDIDWQDFAYNENSLERQDITVTGKLNIPDSISLNNQNEDITANITVSAAPTAEVPTAEPEGGAYNGRVDITLKTETENAKIYYTLDNTAPTELSKLYDGAITIEGAGTHTLRAVTIPNAGERLRPSVEYVNYYNLTPKTYKLTIRYDDKSTENEYVEGENVTVYANTPEDKVFDCWEAERTTLAGDQKETYIYSADENIDVTMPDHDLVLTPKYKNKISTVGIKDLYIDPETFEMSAKVQYGDGEEIYTDIMYSFSENGDELDLTAVLEPPYGEEFADEISVNNFATSINITDDKCFANPQTGNVTISAKLSDNGLEKFKEFIGGEFDIVPVTVNLKDTGIWEGEQRTYHFVKNTNRALISAPELDGERFDHWEISENGKTRYETVQKLSIAPSASNLMITAVYMPVVRTIELTIDDPHGNKQLADAPAACSYTITNKYEMPGEAVENLHISWTPNNNGIAQYGTSYTAHITSKTSMQLFGKEVEFTLADNSEIKVNGKKAACEINGSFIDIVYTFDETDPVSYDDYSIAYDAANNKADVISPEEGVYTVIFAAYSGDELVSIFVNNDVAFTKDDLKKVKNVAAPDSFDTTLADSVRVMLWKDLQSMQPKCAADEKIIK